MQLDKVRYCGLDTLRAIAISIVLMDNYRIVAGDNMFGFMSQLGWVGVDLFFVLSGFLIGNQIFSALLSHSFSLKNFYVRRFLRTLPNYYFVLALYFLFPLAMSGTNSVPSISYLIFIQNLNMPPDSPFSHSWSLCVEEQFYLIFPLIALLIGCSKKSISLCWLVVISAMLVAILIRGYTWHKYGQSAISGELFMEHIYFPSFTRFDGLLPGVAIAIIKNFHPSLFASIQRRGHLLSITGFSCLIVMLYVFNNYMGTPNHGFPFLLTSLGYSLLAISFGILVLAALCQNSLLHRIAIPGAASLALWSYAIYLVHEPIFHIIKANSVHFGLDINTNLTTLISFSASILSGWILYKLVETPFMKMRERYYPTNYKAFTNQ